VNAARVASILKRNGWALNLVFIALGAYFSAGAISSVAGRALRPMPSLDDVPVLGGHSVNHPQAPKTAFLAMAERNLFGASRENLHPVEQTTATEDTPFLGNNYQEKDLRPCTVAASLRGTLVCESAPEWSMAVLYDNSKQTTNVFNIVDASNQISDDATLIEVRSRAIVVRRRDHFELCNAEGEGATATPGGAVSSPPGDDDGPGAPPDGGDGLIDGGEGVAKVSESEYVVDRALVDNALSNLSEVATKARIVPSFKNGKPNGFKLFSIKPGSIFAKIGLQNGDVIQKINGYEINSPDKALELYQKLKDSNSVSLDVQRRGQSKPFSYRIK